MPHQDFDAVRRTVSNDRDPVTFRLGGQEFTCLSSPSLGDTFDLADAPDISEGGFNATNPSDLLAVRVLSNFIRTMLPAEDRNRYDDVLYRIGADQGGVIVAAAYWITEQITPHPSEPPASSSSGRARTGRNSKDTSVGRRRSS